SHDSIYCNRILRIQLSLSFIDAKRFLGMISAEFDLAFLIYQRQRKRIERSSDSHCIAGLIELAGSAMQHALDLIKLGIRRLGSLTSSNQCEAHLEIVVLESARDSKIRPRTALKAVDRQRMESSCRRQLGTFSERD